MMLQTMFVADIRAELNGLGHDVLAVFLVPVVGGCIVSRGCGHWLSSGRVISEVLIDVHVDSPP